MYIQYTGKLLYDGKGDVNGAIEVIMDISRVKELMKSINDIGNHVSNVVEALSDKILASSQKIQENGNDL